MAYKLTSEKIGDVLHVNLTGTRTRESIMAISKVIMKECVQHGTKKVLADVRAMDGHLKAISSYEIPNSFFPTIKDRSVLLKSAVVDLKESEHYFRYFESVVVNGGYTLRFFSDVDEAKKWLQD